VSSKAFRPEVPRSTAPLLKEPWSKEPWSAVLLWWWAALPWGLPRVRAFRRRAVVPCVHRREASSIRRQAVSWWWQPEVSWLLPPGVLSACGARAVCRSREAAAAVGSDARVVLRRAVPGASAQPPVAVRQAVLAAVAALQREGAWDAAEGPQPAAEVPDAEAEPPQAAEEVLDAVAVPRPVAASVASQREADPSAVPWAFRRDQPLPSVRRRAGLSARAIRMSQAASPSERSWQAARCEGLS
jgi:hypothetical protein